MHTWGDEDVDWRGIEDAAEFIGRNLRRFGRVEAYYKEKYGTVRVYCMRGNFFQRWLYRLLYAMALKKWPHLTAEIMSDCDWPELLKGLVDPITCPHDQGYWTCNNVKRCPMCQTEVKL